MAIIGVRGGGGGGGGDHDCSDDDNVGKMMIKIALVMRTTMKAGQRDAQFDIVHFYHWNSHAQVVIIGVHGGGDGDHDCSGDDDDHNDGDDDGGCGDDDNDVSGARAS